MEGGLFVIVLIALIVLFVLWRTAVVVPQQSAFVVERLGRYSGTLGAGFHLLVPFVDVVRYRHSLKEAALDIPAHAFVAYLQNHDQIANGGCGERCQFLASPGRWRAVTTLLLLGPETPMLFQGQEFCASTPFQYFTAAESFCSLTFGAFVSASSVMDAE